MIYIEYDLSESKTKTLSAFFLRQLFPSVKMAPFDDLLFCHSLYALNYVPIHVINLHLVEIFAHISDFRDKIYFKLSSLTP